MDIMKWKENLISVSEKKEAGICPFCDSKNTDFHYTKVHKEIGYLDIWCNSCKKAVHISRCAVPENENSDSIIPDDLIY